MGRRSPAKPLIVEIALALSVREACAAEVPQEVVPSSHTEFNVSNAHGDFTFKESAPSQENAGVGVRLVRRRGELVVAEVVAESPAAKAGILPGQTVESIDGWAMRGVELRDALRRLRGKPGTLVVLRVRKGGKTEKLPLVRSYQGLGPKPSSAMVRLDFVLKEDVSKPCPAQRGECLFLTERYGGCYYSCRKAEEKPQP